MTPISPIARVTDAPAASSIASARTSIGICAAGAPKSWCSAAVAKAMPTMARKTAFKRGAAGCRERRSGSPQVEAGTAEHDRVAVDGAVQRRRGGQDVALVRDRDVEAAQTLAASVPVGHEAQYRVVERDARPRSEEHTSELPSIMRLSYAV